MVKRIWVTGGTGFTGSKLISGYSSDVNGQAYRVAYQGICI